VKLQCTVDCRKTVGENDRFWAAAGLDSLFHLIFTESGDALLSRMHQKGTCRYLRCHCTLSEENADGYENCGGNVYSEDKDGNPVYSFEKINGIFAKYLSYGIKPIVEFDFMPFALSRKVSVASENGEVSHLNHSYPNNWERWEDLLRAFMQNLVETFGSEELKTWYFEVWNEPDNWEVRDWPYFHRMYDIFAEVVTSADKAFRIGGPGAFTPAFFRDFLEHIVNGKNYVTGKTGSRIDFLSYHIYGMSGGWLDEWPLICPTVQRYNQELLWVSRMIGKYPTLAKTPVHLNEWGVCSNYEKTAAEFPPLEIRNSEYSALFFIKLADSIRQIRRKWNLPIEMLLYWGLCLEDDRRTPFAGNRDLMTFPHLPKPILSAYELLARLGKDEPEIRIESRSCAVGILAGKSENSVQLLLYSFSELDFELEMPDTDCRVMLEGLEAGTYELRCTRLDREHHNTYRLWQSGASERVLQDAAALLPDSTETVVIDNAFEIVQTLPSCGVCLVELQKR